MPIRETDGKNGIGRHARCTQVGIPGGEMIDLLRPLGTKTAVISNSYLILARSEQRGGLSIRCTRTDLARESEVAQWVTRQ